MVSLSIKLGKDSIYYIYILLKMKQIVAIMINGYFFGANVYRKLKKYLSLSCEECSTLPIDPPLGTSLPAGAACGRGSRASKTGAGCGACQRHGHQSGP